MGKMTGFLEYERVNNSDIPVQERILNFDEFHVPLHEDERIKQAARCMDCGVPFCQSAMKLSGMVTGCPLHNLIPEWNDQIYNRHFAHAFSRLHKTSNFPEFTGRVCPALCEKACMNGEYGESVTIHDNELFLVETAFSSGYIKPAVPRVRSGKKVAVIGAGPAGMAAADTLNHRGHSVTVYEREDRIGGLLMYGIPNMKLDKSVIARRQALMEEEGVVFKTGINVGGKGKNAVSAEDILKEYDAVVLACGAKKPRPLPAADPKKIKGVVYAVDFLSSTTKSLLKADGNKVNDLKKQGGYIDAEGRHVVIVGGGDTGNDCIGTVIRHGCASVTALEMMPQPPLQRTESNPWPEWPKVLKTDYGHEEAAALFGQDPRIYETTVRDIIVNEKNELTGVRTVKVRFENGKMVEVEDSEKVLPCDLLLIAAGFLGCEEYTAKAFQVSLSPRNTVITDEERYQTSADKVFTAGDMHRGQSLVVWAIAEGRNCAHDVDLYLMGYSGIKEF